MNVVAAVLAAGASRRLGTPKQLVAYRGEPLILRALAAAEIVELDAVAVVLGAHADLIEPVLPMRTVRLVNDEWHEGLASSIHVAVRWAAARHADAMALLLCDQPEVDATHVKRLVRAWEAGHIAAASSYSGVLGAPAVFGAPLFAALSALRGDVGAAGILRRNSGAAHVPFDGAAIDVDLPADLERL